MTVRLLGLLAGVAVSLSAQGPLNVELLGFPPRDSTTACKLKLTDELPAGATEAHLFWIGLAVPTARVGGPDGRIIGTSPPPRYIWVSYDRTGLPVLLADTVYDQMGHRVAQVRFGPGRAATGFTQRTETDTALARKLMNDSKSRTLMEAVDSLMRSPKRSPPAMLDSAMLHRARQIGEFLWTRRCAPAVRS